MLSDNRAHNLLLLPFKIDHSILMLLERIRVKRLRVPTKLVITTHEYTMLTNKTYRLQTPNA